MTDLMISQYAMDQLYPGAMKAIAEKAPANTVPVSVQELRKGQIIVEGKVRTPVKAVEVRPRGCRHKVHVNADCYDYGAEVWVQR